MKRRGSIFYGILFSLLMVFLFSFMAQEHLKLFKTKELVGYFQETSMPKFRWEWYKNGFYQKKLENYISKHYGFREPVIRLYHQYCWDFFGKEYVSFIDPGKEGWLYYRHNVEDYYGTEMYHWFPNAEEARKGYEKEVRLMNKVRGVLADYGVTMLTFIAPSKSIVYPEYLPQREHDTTSLDAREYFIRRFKETGMPCFDMNEFFLQMKDTCSFCLFPPTGDHWNFSCVYAIDSLYRFMEPLRGILMTKIEYGDTYSDSCSVGEAYNRDLEGQLNLLRPMRIKPEFSYKERDYHMVNDSTTTQPSTLFIGNSFLLRSMSYLPPQNAFSDFQFWYYNRVVYNNVNQPTDNVSSINRLDCLLNADYVVWFSSSSQMYRATEGFAEDAIIQLCIGEENFKKRQNKVIDSLFHDQATRNRIAWNLPDSSYRKKLVPYTDTLMRKNPEAYFPEIAGENVPTVRNPQIPKALFRRNIMRNPRKKALLEVKAYQDSIGFNKLLDSETHRAINGKPSLTENLSLTAYDFFYVETKVMMDSLRHTPRVVDSLINLRSKQAFDMLLFETAVQRIGRCIEHGCYDDNPMAAKSFELNLIMNKMNNPSSIVNIVEKSKAQNKRVEKVIRDDTEWVYQHKTEHRRFDKAEAQALLKKFVIEYRFRISPESMARIQQKAQERGKPFLFMLFDDVNYVYNQHQE